MICLDFAVSGLMLKKKQYTYLVAGTKNCISIKVKLDRHWQDLEVFVVCYRDKKEYPYAITNGECLIADMAVISTSGEFKLKLLGSTADGNVVITTNVVTVYINDNKFSGAEGGELEYPTSDYLAEVLAGSKQAAEQAKHSADAAGESAKQATAQADRAQSAADGIRDTADTLQADNEHLKAELKHANRRISVLYDLGKGITHRYETDSETAYSKDVPSGAKVMDVKMVGGKSVAAHQYIDGFAEPFGHGYEYTDDNDYYNVTFTASNGRFRWISLAVIKGHKYYQSLILQVVSGGSVGGANYLGIPWGFAVTKADGTVKKDAVISCTDNVNSLIQVSNIADSDGNFATCRINKKSVRLIDLTQMFGAGNEPTLEQCREIFVNDYYPYNTGTLVSADVTDVQVGDKLIQLPNSISLKSAGSVYDSLEFYEQDGKYYQKHTQRVGVVDLGTLTWNLKENYGRYAVLNWSQDGTQNIFGGNPNILCAKYSYKRIINTYTQGQAKGICVNNKYASALPSIYIDDCDYANLNEFTAAMQGVLLYYELATPIVTVIEVDNRFDAVDISTGDKITFVGNPDYHLPVPNEEEYLIALNEVTV